MPRRRRYPRPGCFHIVNRSTRRIQLFDRTSDYRAFLEILRKGLERSRVRLIAYCVMPNHWHLVLGPNKPEDVSKLMHWVTVTHAVRWHHHRKTVGLGPVYQNRYWSEPLEDADHFVAVCRYVERNPLKAGLVRQAQDWPWGSLADRLRSEPTLPIANTPFLSSNTWLDHVNTPTHREPRVFHNLNPVPLSVENSSDPLKDSTERPGKLAGSAKLIEQGVN
jgi:putative transposase